MTTKSELSTAANNLLNSEMTLGQLVEHIRAIEGIEQLRQLIATLEQETELPMPDMDEIPANSRLNKP